MSAVKKTKHSLQRCSGVELRDARHADLPLLVELAGVAFYEAYIEFDDADEIREYVEKNFTPDYFAEAIRDARTRLEVLADSARLHGYLLLRDCAGPAFVGGNRPLELARLYLRGDQKGRGYGRRLIERVFAVAEQGRFDCIWLQVYDRNVAAMNFYRRFGFEERGLLDFMFAGRIYKDPVMVARVSPGVKTV